MRIKEEIIRIAEREGINNDDRYLRLIMEIFAWYEQEKMSRLEKVATKDDLINTKETLQESIKGTREELQQSIKETREELQQSIKATKDEIKEDIKMLIQMIDRRFEDMNKRFEDMNKRFEEIITYTNKRFEDMQIYMNKRFEDMLNYTNKRFEDIQNSIKRLQWFIWGGFTLLTIVIALFSIFK